MYDVMPITSSKQVDCGPTSLKMLLAYYGEEVSLEDLIRECNTRFIGCTAKDVLRVGRDHGLDMRAYQEHAEDVIHADRPAIVWWMFNHFCVCCGLNDAGRVVICNPNMGRYSMSPDTFASFYSGISLYNGEPHDLPEEEPAEE